VGLAQFFEQAAGEPELGEGGLELIIVLEFFTLLRSHVRLQKDFARVVGLREQAARREAKTKTGEQNQTDFFHALEKPRIVMCG
jgi:hypothetical protein